MFISSDFLEIYYGVDGKIACFFVDREPPLNNLYWHEKLLYLRPAPGYLFIPLIVDLLYKLGVEKQQLLSEYFVTTMEQIGHVSALEETKQISNEEAVKKCSELVKETCSNKDWHNNVNNYLTGKDVDFFTGLAVPFKALQRGDLFLFALCALQFPQELYEKIAEQWFALISTLLLLDDAEDIKTDRETGDENAFAESGMTAQGFKKITDLVSKSLQKISVLNPAMSRQLKKQYTDYVKKSELLNYS